MILFFAKIGKSFVALAFKTVNTVDKKTNLFQTSVKSLLKTFDFDSKTIVFH